MVLGAFRSATVQYPWVCTSARLRVRYNAARLSPSLYPISHLSQRINAGHWHIDTLHLWLAIPRIQIHSAPWRHRQRVSTTWSFSWRRTDRVTRRSESVPSHCRVSWFMTAFVARVCRSQAPVTGQAKLAAIRSCCSLICQLVRAALLPTVQISLLNVCTYRVCHQGDDTKPHACSQARVCSVGNPKCRSHLASNPRRPPDEAHPRFTIARPAADGISAFVPEGGERRTRFTYARTNR